MFCGADHVSLELLDDDTLGLAAYTSISEAWMKEYPDSFPKPLSTASIIGPRCSVDGWDYASGTSSEEH